MDRRTDFGHFSKEQVLVTMLPEEARGLPDRDIELRESLATLMQHVKIAQQAGDSAVFIVPQGIDVLIPLMDHVAATAPRNGPAPRQKIERVYWAVPFAIFAGVADNVRTILVELVAEIRNGLPAGVPIPSRELADRAVSVAVYGDHNQVVVGQAAPGGTAIVGGRTASSGAKPDGRVKTITWWVFGIITSASAIAVIILQVHH